MQNRTFDRGIRLRIWKTVDNRMKNNDKPLKVVTRKLTERMWHLRDSGLVIGQQDKVEGNDVRSLRRQP